MLQIVTLLQTPALSICAIYMPLTNLNLRGCSSLKERSLVL